MFSASNLFNSIMVKKPRYNWFDLDHDIKMSTDMGVLTPCMLQEVVPGDTFKINSQSLIRFAPLLAPVMHRVDVYHHFFFVPNRIVWPGWENFISPANVGDVPPAFPYINFERGSILPGTLPDYLGLPTGDNSGGAVSAIPFAMYQMIYNEYYRDQNLMQKVQDTLQNGNNTAFLAALTNLHNRSWQHDYFTACLPWAQKGTAVELPIFDGDVPVEWRSTGTYPQWHQADQSGFQEETGNVVRNGDIGSSIQGVFDEQGNPLSYDPNGTLVVDGDQASVTINDLRRSIKLQEWLEKNARGGTRYIESILSHFGVKSSDARLQRPEYIGGSKTPVMISEVLQTSATDSESPQGNMAGHAIAVNSGKPFSYHAEEHGYIIGIMSVLPKTAYQQGVPRHWLKNDPLMFYWPEFAQLGEQEVLNKEIYNDIADGAFNDATFGYVPRYAEYKFEPCRVAGDFRTDLNFWHMGRIFAGRPSLSAGFIASDPTTRIFAVESNVNHLWCQVYNQVKARRPMPKFGTPTL